MVVRLYRETNLEVKQVDYRPHGGKDGGCTETNHEV